MGSANMLLLFPPTQDVLAYPHLGIPVLTSYLRAHGHDTVRQVDLASEYRFHSPRYRKLLRSRRQPVPSDSALAIYKTRNPSLPPDLDGFALRAARSAEIIGMSIAYPEQLPVSLVLASRIRELNPNVLLVAGGSLVTANAHSLVDDEAARVFDALIVGDGEEPIRTIAAQAASGQLDLSQVPNCHYQENGSFSPPKAHFVMSPDSYTTPEFSGAAYPWLPIRMSKGCYWRKCAFCTYKVIFDGYMRPNIDVAVRQIRDLNERYHTENFVLVDDAIPAKILWRLAERLIEEQLQIRWDCSAIMDKKFRDPQVAQALVQSGCNTIFFGFESANARVLKTMGKMHDPKLVLEILQNLSDQGIHSHLNVMIGFPTETRKEAQETVDFLRAYRHVYSNFHAQTFSLEEHSDVYTNPSAFGISRIHRSHDHNVSARVGLRFDCRYGMNRAQREYMTRKCQVAYRKQHVSRAAYLRRKASLYKFALLNLRELAAESTAAPGG